MRLWQLWNIWFVGKLVKKKGALPLLFLNSLFLQLVERNNRDSCFVEHFHGKFVGISLFENDPLYARIYNHFGAYRAWLMSAIKSSSFNRNPQFCRLDYGVLFGMNRIAYFVAGTRFDTAVDSQTFAPFFAAFYTRARTVIARS